MIKKRDAYHRGGLYQPARQFNVRAARFGIPARVVVRHNDVGRALDPDCFIALQRAITRIHSAAAA